MPLESYAYLVSKHSHVPIISARMNSKEKCDVCLLLLAEVWQGQQNFLHHITGLRFAQSRRFSQLERPAAPSDLAWFPEVWFAFSRRICYTVKNMENKEGPP